MHVSFANVRIFWWNNHSFSKNRVICIILRVKKTWHPSLQVRSTAALWTFPKTVESTEVVRFVGIKHHKGQPSFTVPSDPEPAMIAKAQTKKICPPSRWHPLRGPPLDWDWVSNLRWLRLKIQVTTWGHQFFFEGRLWTKGGWLWIKLHVFSLKVFLCGQTDQPEDFCLLPLSLLFEVVSKFPLVGFNWAKTLHPSKQMWSLPCKPPAFRPVPKTGTHTNGSAYPSLFSHVATFDIIRLQALLASFANDLERFCRAPMAVPQLVYHLACASAFEILAT